MQNQIRKFAFTPWKKPQNWLNAFKPANTKVVKAENPYTVIPIVRNPEKLKSHIDMTSNKLEHKVEYSTSMKEAFISRHEFNETKR